MKVIWNCHLFSKKKFIDLIINRQIIYFYHFSSVFFFQDSPITTVDVHSLPSSPTSITRREQKQRRNHHSPLGKFIPRFFSLFHLHKQEILSLMYYHRLYRKWAAAEIDMRYFYE